MANWVTYGTDKRIHGVAAWRLPLGLQMLPALILFLGMVRLLILSGPMTLIQLALSLCSRSPQGKPKLTSITKHCVLISAYFRWLVAQGREEEAYVVLKKLHFNGENQEWLDGEFAEICEVSIHQLHVPIRTTCSCQTPANPDRKADEVEALGGLG